MEEKISNGVTTELRIARNHRQYVSDQGMKKPVYLTKEEIKFLLELISDYEIELSKYTCPESY